MNDAMATSPEIDAAADVRANVYVELEELDVEMNIERRKNSMAFLYEEGKIDGLV